MNKLKLKLIMDLMLTIIMILLMGFSFTGPAIHEIVGLIVMGFFVIHCMVNAKWFTGIAKMLKQKKMNINVGIRAFLNFVLMVDILITAISGILISRVVFTGITVSNVGLWTYIHNVAAYSSFIIIAIHVGFHWQMIMTVSKNVCHIKGQNIVRTWILRILALLFAVLGVKASLTGELQ